MLVAAPLRPCMTVAADSVVSRDAHVQLPARADERQGLPELVLSHFLCGEEYAAELAAGLAFETGHSLAEVYDKLRVGIYHLDPEPTDAQAIEDYELDERLARLAARLRPPVSRHRAAEAMVLSTGRRGIPAVISHMFSAQGVPAQTADLAFLAHHRRGGAGIPRQFPSARYIVVDAAAAKLPELVHLANTLRHLHLASEQFNVVVLGDDPAAVAGARTAHVDHVSLVSDLLDLMSAAGVPLESPLTSRERAVLEYISIGATNQQTATALGISIATVKTYLERAQGKLKSCDRASTVAAALRRGWM